ncbi:xylulose-5-phosphate/fructose-6-phosphate phosphoketolase [Microbacteriaceae bacterium SG_E_30_P1]|uniref:Probable phosphoketolase n=1 Tax=Antiquaquibacter oligotrophicus TaxID=2880260 RepID=A0ABT6KMG2_9MICO|nr:phosphoketolase family protein [Antiquaquibacter oligotrophicus]MDH6180297.1 xylulose-5-phosphate/fructose-6-phosphate phosphoketolase [Antiquaquibacter oligotrophicus]UDF13956.1 phosphoketolase family protein [Antiquaquibacter oligotrophicus]
MTAASAASWPILNAVPPNDETLTTVHDWWRTANYLSVGQIYLLDNPLLRRPLTRDDIKPRLLGHWGTTPGLNLLWAHLNRVIVERDLNSIYICGPGHGGPGMVASAYLDGTYSELYSDIDHSEEGLRRLFRQFSFPGGIPSHAAPETPGSIHEGGELGYSLSHAYGAAFDNPDLLVAAVVGDGESETGPLATAWHSNKFVDPLRDGVVLPILHLNGYKIANPTVLARIPESELLELMRGYGHTPYLVSGGFDGEDPMLVHRRLAETMDAALDHIGRIKASAADGSLVGRPAWPMIILRTPKGWTCPAVIDGHPAENNWRSHQVPLANARDTEEHTRLLEEWLQSYRPDELFDEAGAVVASTRALAPQGDRRMSANPVANGGVLRVPLRLPDFRKYAVDVPRPGETVDSATGILGTWLRDVVRDNPQNFRIFGPDETASNRLQAVYEVTDKQWNAEFLPIDADNHLARAGRVMEMLSEHQCQGWLEGYLLTGRHGLLNSYEAFIHIVDSMFNQHAKWITSSKDIAWRRPISSLNYLLSSHVWRQDHNGFSHQDPGFIDHVVNKKADVIRVYLPFDANTLLSTYDHCLRTVDYVNVVVAGKQPQPNWLTMDQAIEHCTRGLGILNWAGTEVAGEQPDAVLAAAGDVPTLEMLAAASILRVRVPGLRLRVVNVVDLMRLQSEREHPHGLSDHEFDADFTVDKPIVFAYHGYPWLIHRLTYKRHGHDNLHVRGYKEEGTTTTPFDMVMLNDLDRYKLVIDVLDRVPGLAEREGALRQEMQDARVRARAYTREHGEDIPEVAEWSWSGGGAGSGFEATGDDNA